MINDVGILPHMNTANVLRSHVLKVQRVKNGGGVTRTFMSTNMRREVRNHIYNLLKSSITFYKIYNIFLLIVVTGIQKALSGLS